MFDLLHWYASWDAVRFLAFVLLVLGAANIMSIGRPRLSAYINVAVLIVVLHLLAILMDRSP